MDFEGSVITGTRRGETLRGTLGDDEIYGLGAADRLLGRVGEDWLSGGAGSDWLYGGAGNDVLRGGIGKDHLFGGAGADLFVLGDGRGVDRVADFNFAAGDRLTLANPDLLDADGLPDLSRLRLRDTGDSIVVKAELDGRIVTLARLKDVSGLTLEQLFDVPDHKNSPYSVATGDTVQSSVGFAGDSDWFKVELEAGQDYVFDLESLSEGGDPYLVLYDAAGQVIAWNDDGGPGLDSRLEFASRSDQFVFVSAEGYGDSSFDYRLGVDLSEDQGPVMIDGVPAYFWYHGCSPTAAASIMGYWDQNGLGDLFDANLPLEVFQTGYVQDHISSPAHNAKYDPTPDDVSLPVPPTTSLAGFMGTSVDPLGFGWTWVSQIPGAFEDYGAFRGYDISSVQVYNAADGQPGGSQWERYVAEIDAGRPVQLAVDTDGNGGVDHSVPGIGYEDRGQDGLWYAAYTTWSESETPIWREFRTLAPGDAWAVGFVNSVVPGVAEDVFASQMAVPVEAAVVPDNIWLEPARDPEEIEAALASDGVFDAADAKIFAQMLELTPVADEFWLA